MDRNFKFPVTTIGFRPPPSLSLCRPSKFHSNCILSPLSRCNEDEGRRRASVRAEGGGERDALCNWAHSLSPNYGGREAQLVIWQQLPSFPVVVPVGWRSGSRGGWLLGWLVGPYYLPTTKYERQRQRTNEGGGGERLLEKRWFRKLGVVTRPTDGGRARR